MPTPVLPLAFDHVSFAVGNTKLIEDLSFTLAAGPRTVILGPNGAGKSLTLRLCHGLLQPTSGAVRWAGPGAQDTPRRQAMVFQNPVMLRRSALDNVVYALALNGVPRAQRVARAEQALARVGLDAIARRPARALSTGEQQRLALARAWALEPDVLFLDEPTASLDPAATRAIEQAIDGVHQSGAKVVMTTHDLGQAHRLADEVLFLHHGRLVESGPAADFFAAPRSREAAAFLAGELLW
jgi:tungstate transport system ATP-binding protein